MPKTLEGAKPDLENDLKDLLQKAAFEAMMTASIDNGADSIIATSVKDTITDAAQKFSDKFAEEAYKPMAQAIYKFVKEIGIMASPKTLMSPHGLVSGSIMLNEFTIT